MASRVVGLDAVGPNGKLGATDAVTMGGPRGRKARSRRLVIAWFPAACLDPLPPPRRDTRRPQIRRGYPLSLSISISGGKETYKDSLSNGERTGKCPALESIGFVDRIVVCRSVLRDGPGPSPLEGGA